MTTKDRSVFWMTEAHRTRLDSLGFNGDDISDIEAALQSAPAWRSRPTCPGRWLSSGGIDRYMRDERDIEDAAVARLDKFKQTLLYAQLLPDEKLRALQKIYDADIGQ